MGFRFSASDLNFRVLTSGTEPTSAGVENDIVIITSVPMENWTLSTHMPTGAPRSNGDVWIRYSVVGNTFNALKSNTMLIATISAWQYVNDEWVNKSAKSCRDGQWVDWVIFLYNGGSVNEGLTGGWVNVDDGRIKVQFTADGMTFVYNEDGSGGREGAFYTKNKINLSDYSTLSAVIKNVSTLDSEYDDHHVAIGITSTTGEKYPSYVAQAKISESGTHEVTVPLTGITGEYYIATNADVATGVVDKIRLE